MTWLETPGGVAAALNRYDKIYNAKEMTMTTAPNLTFYYGQQITDIVPEGDGWAIVLESGVRIVNLDAEYEMPDNTLVGMFISKATFGSDLTTLSAGPEDNPLAAQINFNPTQYGIDDPSYEGDGLYIPQDTSSVEKSETMEAYEEQLAARQAEGPTTPDAESDSEDDAEPDEDESE